MRTTRDFENPEESFGRVSAEVFAAIMGVVADIAFVVDAASGIVRDVAYGASDLAGAGLGRLVGRALPDLVTTESRPKIEALLGGGAGGRWRHANFPIDGDSDVPISLQAFGLGGGRMLVVGRDERQGALVQRRFIEAQHELERSHARLRQSDLRFQTLLALSDLAVMTLDGTSLALLDINAVARELLPGGAQIAVGSGVLPLFDRADADAVRDALLRAAASSRIGSVAARLRGGRGVTMQVAPFRFESVSRLLVRIVDEETPAPEGADEAAALFAHLPHGLVLVSADLRILHANRAFVDLAQLSVEENAIGQPLDRFLGRNGVDTDILAAALRERDVVRDFATLLAGAFGAVSEIDVDAVRLGGGRQETFGLLVRIRERDGRRPLPLGDRSALAERMTEMVGRVSLKDIVRDSTDVIERLSIETALGMTDNNRAAAAEMLGISRQGLYAKLARYGIDNSDQA